MSLCLQIKLLSIFIVSTAVFVLPERSKLQEAANVIDEQLGFVEYVIATSRVYGKLNFLDKYIEFMKNETFPFPEEPKLRKRLLILHKCYNMIRVRMNDFLNKHNSVFKRYFDILFPDDVKSVNPGEETALREELVKISVEMKQFFLHEMPNFFYKYGQKEGMNFSKIEVDRAFKGISEARERGDNESFHFAKQMGVDKIPSINLTTVSNTTDFIQ